MWLEHVVSAIIKTSALLCSLLSFKTLYYANNIKFAANVVNFTQYISNEH